ncbi:MAG: NAD(P)(+) transhydrogenase (Re/Si-specific) subunit beta [Elusimicrobia bacterium]|nr:NAD(P)(+) transhydrogenase (Re/Si-specific) subunit beta [Elusimicrobiota bacterium]
MSTLISLAYLSAAVLFMLGLKQLSSVETARTGNLLSLTGMGLAICATALKLSGQNLPLLLGAAALGTLLGTVSALRAPMTAMPQMVALFNGFGGGASALVAVLEFYKEFGRLAPLSCVTIFLSAFVGWITLTGSLVAFGKLQGILSGKPILLPGRHLQLVMILSGILALGVYQTVAGPQPPAFLALCALSILLGVLLVIPIGGADMPVVISLLNSYSGIAVALTGFVLFNHALIITGSLVGASGLILTRIMCKAMNRSLAHVLFGGFGTEASGAAPGASTGGGVKEATPQDAVTVLENSRHLIIVPGYGMAVAQAQYAVRDLARALEGKGVAVQYAIHPVAGRMPGHMNVLLAEANVPYDQLFDLDQINDRFAQTDAALIVGANDVVNPAAKEEPASPIYGMPILNAQAARTVIVLKRSLNPGFAGIENALFTRPNTLMVFGDAKKTLTQMASILKQE